MPPQLVSELMLTAELENGETALLAALHDQHQRLIRVPLSGTQRLRSLRVELGKTWGGLPPVIYKISVY